VVVVGVTVILVPVPIIGPEQEPVCHCEFEAVPTPVRVVVVGPQNGPTLPVIELGGDVTAQHDVRVIFPIVINCLPGSLQFTGVAQVGAVPAPHGEKVEHRVTILPLKYLMVICVTGPTKDMVTLPWVV
jgi:hypothetical protein